MREKDNYDRMVPTPELLNRLEVYSKITWGTNAYALSVAEAAWLVQEIKLLKELINELLTGPNPED